jgi:subtilisin family serine protease
MMRLGAGGGAPVDGRKADGSQARAKAATGALGLAPVIGSFRPDVVLGYRLSAEVRGQLAQTYRLEAGRSESVTRLLLPDYLGATEGLAALQARFPDQLFGLNYVYASYRGAGEDDAGPPGPAASPSAGCDTARCYGPTMIGWHADLGACARNVVVGIIDTGLDADHPALKRLRLIQNPADAHRHGANWHGTGVAALLAGARESSTPGLIPDARFIIVDAFFSGNGEASQAGKAEGGGDRTITDTDHLLWALETLQHRHAEVVNMSLVGPSDPAIHAEIRKMAREGVVFVAAAGNGGPAAAAAFPAAYPEVIAVTAVDRNKRGYAEANHGGYIDVAAPGVRVWTALPGEANGFLSGTSFAAPFVTAIAAATYNSTPMKTAAQRQSFSPKDEVIERMAIEKLGSGQPGTRDGVFGLGLVRAPAGCSPPPQPQLANRPAPTETSPVVLTSGEGWRTQVHHASSLP